MPSQPLTDPLTASAVLAALEAERSAATRSDGFTVTSARRQNALVVLELEPLREGKKRTALDEALEGSKAVWFEGEGGRGEVVVVDSDRGEIVLRFVQGQLPSNGETVRIFPPDFLTPLIELWTDQTLQRNALAVLTRASDTPIASDKPLKAEFVALRQRQADAVRVALYPTAAIIGPPGTGKTYTVGALAANLLRRFPGSRVILTGPTNVSVDTALVSVDDWLVRIGREDLRPCMKRVGSRFDTKRYGTRDHLLAPGLYEASVEIAMLELEEPSKTDLERYVAWKERLESARGRLKSDIQSVASSSRLVAMTTASLFHYYQALKDSGDWHFVIADEASQIMMPAALMAAGLGRAVTFAGDPHQLAPIVKSDQPDAQRLLGRSAFEWVTDRKQVTLNEQSRMAAGICDVVSNAFYFGDLRVCSKALRDPAWKAERSAWFIEGRQVPRVMVDDRGGAPTWSAKYHGMIRFDSAKVVEALVNELLGSYVSVGEMLVLTPFRAQRALLRAMLRRDGLRDLRISTVHRSQGSESKIVIFDPVDAGSPFLNGEGGRRLINVAISRAQAHLMIPIGPKDLANPHIKYIRDRAAILWDRPGKYASPLRVRLRQA